MQDCRYPLTHLQSAGHLSLLQVSLICTSESIKILKRTQVTQPSVLVAFLPLTSPTSLDSAHVPLLRTALALLEVHPDRALGVAVTTEPALARCLENTCQKFTFSYGFICRTLRLGSSQPVRLVTWNSTVAFPNKTIDSDKLLNWALRHNSQVDSCSRFLKKQGGYMYLPEISLKHLTDCALVAIATPQEHGSTKEPWGPGLHHIKFHFLKSRCRLLWFSPSAMVLHL